MAPRETAGNFARRNVSSGSRGSDWPTVKIVGGSVVNGPLSAAGAKGVRRGFTAFRRAFAGVRFVFPGDQNQQTDAEANRAVGDVEGGEADLLAAAPDQIEAEKIDHLMIVQAVKEVAGDAAKNQPQGKLAQRQMDVEMTLPGKQDDQGQDGNRRQQIVAAVKQAP